MFTTLKATKLRYNNRAKGVIYFQVPRPDSIVNPEARFYTDLACFAQSISRLFTGNAADRVNTLLLFTEIELTLQAGTPASAQICSPQCRDSEPKTYESVEPVDA